MGFDLSAVLVAALSLVGTLAGSYLSNKKTMALIMYRIQQLEKKQDLHNNAVARLYEVERKLGIDEEKISVANHRIDDLEQFHK